MTGQLTRTIRLAGGVALVVALMVSPTGAVPSFGAVEASTPGATDPQDLPADDFAGYHGLAEPGTGTESPPAIAPVTARRKVSSRSAGTPRTFPTCRESPWSRHPTTPPA